MQKLKPDFISLSGANHSSAISQQDWLYFFRRGAEASISGASPRPPAYNHHKTALDWWALGYEWGKELRSAGFSPYRSYDYVDLGIFRNQFSNAMQAAQNPAYTPPGGYSRSTPSKTLITYVKKAMDLYPELFFENYQPKGNTTMSEQLYKVIGTTTYGTKVGEDGDMIILNVKGDYQPYPSAKIEKVMPFTVAVSFGDGRGNYHYRANQNEVAKGDFILAEERDGFKILKVVEVDTKSNQATRYLSGSKIGLGAKLTAKQLPAE